MRFSFLLLTLLFSLLLSGCAIGLGLPIGPVGMFFYVHANPDTISPNQEYWMNKTKAQLIAQGFGISEIHTDKNQGFKAWKHYKQVSHKDWLKLNALARQGQQSFFATLHTIRRSPSEMSISVNLADPVTEIHGAKTPVQCDLIMTSDAQPLISSEVASLNRHH